MQLGFWLYLGLPPMNHGPWWSPESDVNWNNKAINTTPFMEKISESKNAARLVNSYSTHRCSPSRAALLSGLFDCLTSYGPYDMDRCWKSHRLNPFQGIYPFRYGLGKAAIKSQYLPIGIDPGLELLPRRDFPSIKYLRFHKNFP